LYKRPAYSPDLNWLYFSSDGSIRVLDCSCDTLLAVSVSRPGHLTDLWFNPTYNRLYACLNFEHKILVIDGASLQVVDTIFTGVPAIGDVLFNPLVNKIYLSGQDYETDNQLVFVFNAENGGLKKAIVTGLAGDYEDQRMVLHPEQRKLYCSNGGSSTIAVIDCFEDSVIKTIPVPEFPNDLTINTINRKLYSINSGGVSVLDYDADTLITLVSIPSVIYWFVWHQGVNKLYVEGESCLYVIDGESNRLITTIPHIPNYLGAVVVPGACNLKDLKLCFSVTPPPHPAVLYIVDCVADTILDSIPELVQSFAATWHERTDKIYFHYFPRHFPSGIFIGVIDGRTDSLIDSIPLPLSPSQFPEPFSHSNADRVYWSLDCGDYYYDTLNGGCLIIDCNQDTIVKLLQFPVPEGIGGYIFGSGFDPLNNRIFISAPSSHLYVFRDELLRIKDESFLRPGLQLTAAPVPFRRRVTINYHLAAPAEIEIKIFSTDGRLIKVLTRQKQNSGNHSLIWDGTDTDKNPVPPGTYFINLKGNQQNITKKVLFTR